jgi:molecular chaperone GrpE
MTPSDDTNIGEERPDPRDPELEDDLGAELEFRGDVLETELAAARAEADAWRDKALRATAEFDNYRKRTMREREEERRRAGERIVGEMLPVIDDLQRAIEHATEGGDLEHLLHGAEAVNSKMVSVLEREGVGVIDPLGQPFDPHKHEAVGQREDPSAPEHTVLEVLRKGYEMGDRVVRHAMVIVSTEGPEAGK